MPNLEKGDGKNQSPECSFCLATVSCEGFFACSSSACKCFRDGGWCSQSWADSHTHDVNEHHKVMTVRRGPLANHGNRTEASMYKS